MRELTELERKRLDMLNRIENQMVEDMVQEMKRKQLTAFAPTSPDGAVPQSSTGTDAG